MAAAVAASARRSESAKSMDCKFHSAWIGVRCPEAAAAASAARSAAFYWQAEALAGALRGRLGPAEFQVFIGLVAVPQPPDWPALLRERWYFSDWDIDWLAGQIRPAPATDSP